MRLLTIVFLAFIMPVAAAAAEPSKPVAASEIPSATHPLEAEFWAAFKRAAVPGLSVAQARPFARALAAGPEKSARMSYLIQAMLGGGRPEQSPYFGADAQVHIDKLVTALRAIERPTPSKDDVLAALRAMDVFTRTHTASLNLARAAREVLPTPYTALQIALHLRRGGENAEFFSRWADPVAKALGKLAVNAANEGLTATAAGVYLYAHWLTTPAGVAIEPTRYTDMSWEPPLTALQSARGYAAYAAWDCFWQTLDPAASETQAVIDVVNRDPVLARSNMVSVLGFTPGDAAVFGARYRTDVGLPKTTYHVVAGKPAQWRRVGQEQADAPAVWPEVEAPEVAQAGKRLGQARQALVRELDRYQEARRRWSPDEARDRLAEFDGVAPGAGRSSAVDSAQRGLDDARAAYQKDLRDGAYVGRSPDRADTIITRDLTSTERRAREFELEVLERSLANERREAQYQQDQARARSQQRDQLVDEIHELEQKIDTRGHRAKVAELKESVAYYEKRYADALKNQGAAGAGSGISARSQARTRFIRETIRDAVVERYNELASKAKASGTERDEMERLWFAWLFDTPELRDSEKVRTFYGTKEAEEAGEAEKAERELRGKPLSEFAEVLLEPLSPKGPTQLVAGWSATFEPRFPPSVAWRLNQVAGILDDAWFRFAHEPYTMRGHVFEVVKVLRALTNDDALTVDSLRPWVKRFRAAAPAATQDIVLKWDADPKTTALLSRSMQ